MLQPLGVNGPDLVDVQVELRGLGGDALGDLGELGVGAADDGAGAGALRGAVVIPQTAHVVSVCKGEMFKQIFSKSVRSVYVFVF